MAFITAPGFLVTGHRQKRISPLGPGRLSVPVLPLAVRFGRVPQLVSLILAVTAVAVYFWLFGITRHISVWGLL